MKSKLSPKIASVAAVWLGISLGQAAPSQFLNITTVATLNAVPIALAVDRNGNIYVAEDFAGDSILERIAPNGSRTTLYRAFLGEFLGVAVDGVGNVYVTNGDEDYDNGNTILKITPSGAVAVFAGVPGEPGSNNGNRTVARFEEPTGIVVDRHNNIYVADHYNSTIRKITPAGDVSTFAGSAGHHARVDGTGSAARFFLPTAPALDEADNLFVLDTGNNAVRKITPAGMVSTIARLPESSGHEWYPTGIAVFRSSIYVADQFNSVIRYVTMSGIVSTAAGQPEVLGDRDGLGTAARLWEPEGVAVTSAGMVYIADTGNRKIRRGTPVDSIKPTIRITSPTNGFRTAIPTITVSGEASDDQAIARVEVQRGTDPFRLAKGTTQWSLPVTLKSGTNTMRVKSIDTSSNGSSLVSIQVSWADEVRPNLTIAYPTNLAVVSNAMRTITGKASDNGVVTGVWVRVNSAAYQLASGTNNWFIKTQLQPGTNTVRAYALDAIGLASTTAVHQIILAVPTPLVLRIDPPDGGRVQGASNGQLLDINRGYRLVAIPRANFLFVGWSGSITSSSPVLDFLMTNGLELQANFQTNRFLAVQGTYNGLFAPADNAGAIATHEVAATNSGYITLTLTAQRQLSGSLLMGGSNYSFTGLSDFSGHAHIQVNRSGQRPVDLDLAFDVQETPDDVLSYQVTGLATSRTWTASVRADRAGRYAGPSGRHTFLIPGAPAADAATRPGGDGAGTITVTTNGTLTLLGALGDGTALSQSTTLSQNGDWPLFASLYSGKGLLLGWGSSSSNFAHYQLLATNVIWLRPAGTTAFYRGGFTEGVEIRGARYQAPGPGANVLNWTNGVLLMDGGNLSLTLSNQVTWSTNRLAISANANRIRLTNDLVRGTFGGTFVHPQTLRTNSFSGAYLQLPAEFPGWGGGWFRGTNQTGYIELIPNP